MQKILIFIIIFCLTKCAYGQNDVNNQPISLDLQHVTIQDALHILAKFIHHNIVISPNVHGTTSLHLNQVPARQAFQSLLVSQELVQWRVNNVWLITTRAEWMKQKQEELKSQAVEDEVAPLVTRIWQIHYAKADEIMRLLSDNRQSFVSKRGHVRADKRTNIICIRDTEERIQEINSVILRLDIPVRQVLIEAHLASIDSDHERELGIDFSVQPPHYREVDGRGYSVAAIKLADGSLLDVKLSALEREGHGELISNPSLFTANQQTASIEAGEEIPYQEVSNSGGTAVTFKKAVLSLKVTPQIMPEEQVLLQLQVNQDKPNKRMVLGVPAISTRQISTHILVKSGQTVVLGGIYESNKEQEQQQIPILGKIPLVGWLFRQQNVATNKRELLIFVTPKIIN